MLFRSQDVGLSKEKRLTKWVCKVFKELWLNKIENSENFFNCMYPNGTVFIRLQNANGPSGPITTYGRYCTLIICMYSNAQPCYVILSHICHNGS